MGTGGKTCEGGGDCEAGEELRGWRMPKTVQTTGNLGGWQREKFGVVCVHLDRSDHVKIP